MGTGKSSLHALKNPISITLLLVCQAVWAQSYRISTIAGGQPVPLQRIAVDAQGNLYLTVRNDVFRLDPRGNLAHIAGNSRADYSGDGGPAVNAQLNQPRGIAVDAAGNLYVADMVNFRVRKITPEGMISTLAAVAGDAWPCSVAVDRSGNVYVVNYYAKTIQKITPGGALTTIAGAEAKLGLSYDTAGIVVDDSGNVYVSDATSPVIRKITPQGVISTIAGNLITGYAGDGGPAVNAEFSEPAGLALDSLGNLLIRDARNCRIRKIGPNGIITTELRRWRAGRGGAAESVFGGGGRRRKRVHRGAVPGAEGDSVGHHLHLRQLVPTGIRGDHGGGCRRHGLHRVWKLGLPALPGRRPDCGGPADQIHQRRRAGAGCGGQPLHRRFSKLPGAEGRCGWNRHDGGGEWQDHSGDGGPAVTTSVGAPFGLAVAADGTLPGSGIRTGIDAARRPHSR